MPDIRQQLSQLSNLKREIRLRENQLAELKEQFYAPDKQPVRDTVKGSQREWPYCRRTLIVVGDTPEILDAKARTRKAAAETISELWKLRARCAEEYQRLTEWIARVDDSQMRQILTLRYVKGESFQQIAFAIGETDEQVPRRAHNKFLSQFDEKDELDAS